MKENFDLNVRVIEMPNGGAVVVCGHVAAKWDTSSGDLETMMPAKTWGGGTSFRLASCEACGPAFQAIVDAVERRYKRPDVN
jgi:hypothetical protein